MSSTSIIKLLLTIFIFSSVFLIQGCLSSEMNTRFYVLDPLDMDIALKDKEELEKNPSIEIISLSLPQYLERPQIVTRNNINELFLAEYHQWGGNLRQNMLRVLAKNLSQLLDTPDISISRRDPRSPADFRLQVEVLKFERDPDGKVRLIAQWRLSSGKDKIPLTTQVTEIESTLTLTELDYSRLVSNMSTLMGELSLIITNEILKQYSQIH